MSGAQKGKKAMGGARQQGQMNEHFGLLGRSAGPRIKRMIE